MPRSARNAAGELPESLWQQQVTNLATAYGWRWYHAPDNRPVRARSGRVHRQHVVPGFPDLVLVRKPELIFAELKTTSGRISTRQVEWLQDLQECGVETYIWRPQDFDEVHERLARGRHRTGATHRGGTAA